MKHVYRSVSVNCIHMNFFANVFRARPLKRLCEFEGKPIPKDYKSDCYQDVDETEFACKEKYRIMVNIFKTLNLYCQTLPLKYVKVIKQNCDGNTLPSLISWNKVIWKLQWIWIKMHYLIYSISSFITKKSK